MTPIAFAAVPLLLALVLWAIIDLEQFGLYILLGAMLVPASIIKIVGTNVALADFLLMIALAAWLVTNSIGSSSGPWLRSNWLALPAALLVCVNAASLAWSTQPHSTLLFTIQIAEIAFLFMILFASVPSSIRNIRNALLLLIGLTCVMAVAALATYAAHPKAAVDGVDLPGLNKNTLGSFLAVGLVLAFTFLVSSQRSRHRILLASATVLEGAGLAASVSRGAMIGALIAIFLASLLLRRARLFTLVATAMLVVVFLIAIGPRAAARQEAGGGYDSSVVRQYAWAGAVKKIESRPLLGTGGATYLDTLPQLHGFVTNDALNLFLLTWAELGVPGMASVGLLFFRFGWLLARTKRLTYDASVPAVAAGCAAVSLFVHFQVDVSWTRGTTSMAFAMLGLVLALTRLGGAEMPRKLDRSKRAVAMEPHALAPVA